MTKEIVVLDNNSETETELRDMLRGHACRLTMVTSFGACEDYVRRFDSCILLLDLDTVAVDNRSIAQFRKKYPQIGIIAKSEEPFHPELGESLRTSIFACLAKPLDPDELVFWLKALSSANGAPSGDGDAQ